MSFKILIFLYFGPTQSWTVSVGLSGLKKSKEILWKTRKKRSRKKCKTILKKKKEKKLKKKIQKIKNDNMKGKMNKKREKVKNMARKKNQE